MARPQQDFVKAGPCSRDGSRTARWAVALLACAPMTMLGTVVTAVMTGSYTGPSFTVMASLSIILLAVIIVTASIATFCVLEERVVVQYVTHLSRLAKAYLLIGVVAICVWSTTIRTAARYNCSHELSCDFTQPSEIFFGCDEKHKRFIACENPDVKKEGEYFFSRWGDDCYDDGGSDDKCRGFTSKKDCINYKNPLKDDVEKCDGKGTTAIEAVGCIAVALCAMTAFTMLPAAGFALSAWNEHRFPTSSSAEEPPLADAVEMATVPIAQATAVTTARPARAVAVALTQ